MVGHRHLLRGQRHGGGSLKGAAGESELHVAMLPHTSTEQTFGIALSRRLAVDVIYKNGRLFQ